MTRTTQNARVLDLLRHRSLTDNDARDELGLNRLGARIWDLRHGKLDGVCYDIETVREPHDHGTHARYVLKSPKFEYVKRAGIYSVDSSGTIAPKKEQPHLFGEETV